MRSVEHNNGHIGGPQYGMSIILMLNFWFWRYSYYLSHCWVTVQQVASELWYVS